MEIVFLICLTTGLSYGMLSLYLKNVALKRDNNRLMVQLIDSELDSMKRQVAILDMLGGDEDGE